jgi:hypothetical protein
MNTYYVRMSITFAVEAEGQREAREWVVDEVDGALNNVHGSEIDSVELGDD